MMNELIPPLFLIVAFLHSSVGLAGGTTYSALLILYGISYASVPSISLTFNLIVSLVTSLQYYFSAHLAIKKVLPFLLFSIPFSYLGSLVLISQVSFLVILVICLMIVIIKLQFPLNKKKTLINNKKAAFFFTSFIASILGFISGVIGIGGGIFLVPIMIVFQFATVKQASACGAIFIFFNSAVALITRLANNQYNFSIELADLTYFLIFLLLGTFWGSYLGSKKFPPILLKNILSFVLCMVCFFLILKGFSLL